jgi:hypothetical protein
MALGDPFSTTADLAYKSGASVSDSFQKNTDYLINKRDALQERQYQEQKQDQEKQKTFQMLQMLMGDPKSKQKLVQTSNDMKASGALTNQVTPLSDEEYNQKAGDLIKTMSDAQAQKMGVGGMSIVGVSDPAEQRKRFSALFKASGIPEPQPKITPIMDFNKMPETVYKSEEQDSTDQSSGGNSNVGFNYDVSTGKLTLHGKETSPEAQAMKEQTMAMSKQRLQDQEESKNSTIATSLNKQINPMNANRGSQLGRIGETTIRSRRALDLLNDKSFKIDAQVLSGISSDLAGIMQGGAPTQVGMSEQDYNTLQKTLANSAQYLSGHPGDALPDDIRNYLTDTFNRLNETGKFYIKNNLKTVEDLQGKWINKNKEAWNSSKQDIFDTYGIDDSSSNNAKSTLKATPGMSSSQSSSKWTLVQ